MSAQGDHALRTLRGVLDACPEAMLALSEDGRVVHANLPMERLFGYTAGGLAGRSVSELLPELAEPGAGPFAPQMSGVRSDGARFSVEVRRGPGSPALLSVRIPSVPADLYLSERRGREEAEEAAGRMAQLQAMTAAFGEALLPQEVATVLVEGGMRALGANAGWVTWLDADRENLELIYSRGYPPDIDAAFRCFPVAAPVPAAEVVRTGEPIWFESKEQFYARYPAFASYDDQSNHNATFILPMVVGGRPAGSMALSFNPRRQFSRLERDFALALARECGQALQRAYLYHAEQRARAEAQAAVRLRDEFLSIAAHELKTPLTSLRGFSQLTLRQLERSGELDARRLHDAMGTISRQAEKLSRLINQLLDVSRIHAGRLTLELRAGDLRALVDAAIEGRVAGPGPRRFVVRAPELLVAVFDALRLEQVLTNLLDNAVKFSPAEAPIEIDLQPGDKGSARLTVRDHGPGIPEAHRPHIFERFYQAERDRAASGMGLGLYISREIVGYHGGRLTAEFPEGGGTCFVVQLPLQPAPAGGGAPA